MTLPASSFISIDRVSGSGDIKSGHRQVIGQLAPRGQLKPQFLVPSRIEVTRQLVRTFEDLDLVLVNVQSIRGKQLTSSIARFLSVIPRTVPLLIVASSPADLVAIDALLATSGTPEVLSDTWREASVQMRPVNRDRVTAERQFCYAIDGLAEKSDMIARLVAQAQRAWWATRQSMSITPPPEALAFESLYDDLVSRSPGMELELLEGAKQLILQESVNSGARDERREAVVQAVYHDSSARSIMVLARSESAARELKTALAQYIDVSPSDLMALGIQVQNVFSAWPSASFDVCVAAGYFGTSTIDMLFASKAAKLVMVVDQLKRALRFGILRSASARLLDCPDRLWHPCAHSLLHLPPTPHHRVTRYRCRASLESGALPVPPRRWHTTTEETYRMSASALPTVRQAWLLPMHDSKS